jgi:hypothetical protein
MLSFNSGADGKKQNGLSTATDEYEIFAVFMKLVSFSFSVTNVQHPEFIESEVSVEQTASVVPQHESFDDERVSKRCVLIEIPHE